MDLNEYVSFLEQSLGRCSSEAQSLFRLVIGSALCLQRTLSISTLSSLLQVPENTVIQQLNLLHPFINTPSSLDEPLQPFPSTLESALFDSVSSCSIDPGSAHEVLAANCFRIMGEYLRPNICDISLSGTDRLEISGDDIANLIPEAVIYACTNWVAHAWGTNIKETDDGRILPFLQTHFLHWLEVLSLTGNATESLPMVQTLQTMLLASLSKHLLLSQR
jgi:hypothetical protein